MQGGSAARSSSGWQCLWHPGLELCSGDAAQAALRLYLNAVRAKRLDWPCLAMQGKHDRGSESAASSPTSLGPESKRARIHSSNMTNAPGQTDHADQSEFLDDDQLIPRTDFVRLLQQALAELGHCNISRSLEQASSLTCESGHIKQLRECVLQGHWLQACECAQQCMELTTSQQQQAQFVLLREHVLEVRSVVQNNIKCCACASCTVGSCLALLEQQPVGPHGHAWHDSVNCSRTLASRNNVTCKRD